MNSLTAEEKIAFLEHRHALILKWLHNRVKEARSWKRPVSVAVMGDLRWPDEIESDKRSGEDHNDRCESKACTYEYVIEAIDNGTKNMQEALENKLNPSNEFEI